MLHVFSIQSPLLGPTPFAIGVPLPKGKYSANGGFTLQVAGTGIACHTKVTGLWSDKSVRWLLIEGILPATTGSNLEVMLSKSSYLGLSIKPKCVVDTGSAINIQLRDGTLSLSKTQFLHLSSLPCLEHIQANVQINHRALQLINITLEHQTYYDAANQPLFCDIAQTAQCLTESGSTVNLIANLRMYFVLNKMELQLKVHNPQPQVHHGGKWDLGNENSLNITEFSLQHKTAEPSQSSFSQHHANDVQSLISQQQTFSTLHLVQHSSGGEAWDSPNHKLADNQVHLSHKGATCTLDGATERILRPNPSMCLSTSTTRLVMIPHRFWQKFPMSAMGNKDALTLGFTDPNSDQPIELQPGEIKSHDVSYILSPLSNTQNVGLTTPALAIAPDLLSAAQALPWFDVSCKQDKLQALIDEGINGPHNFFAKREALDEFGWRNFGDIYADHEAQHHASSEPFVSHYNNQYDPLYGFLKQWLLTGDMRWKSLADDLFDHLVHIDLYHTELDKPEYNHGLFWHTDHYVQAQTASHRTYSKHQQADVYMDHAGGGGPGAHHCYTSGLALYYWLTGSKDAYKGFMGIMRWMSNIYEGDQTLLGLFLRIKNANQLTLPFSQKLLLGNGTGVLRNVFTNKYPLDRGTGNYVNVLLDTFELTQDLHYLSQAEQVMLSTISEYDDIANRNFDDIENTWFYVVFLQSVAKYLYIVSAIDSEIPLAQPILKAFLHYSDYIKTHEAPYLTYQERLEYPNDTWTAQDLRKVQVLSCAALLTDGQQSDYVKKANELQTWIEQKLKHSDEREYTRLLVLMMQNYGSLALVNAEYASEHEHIGKLHRLLIEQLKSKPNSPSNAKPYASSQSASQTASRDTFQSTSQSTFQSTPKSSSRSDSQNTQHPTSQNTAKRTSPNPSHNTWQRCLNFAKYYSISKERRHLVQRIPKLQKWLGKP